MIIYTRLAETKLYNQNAKIHGASPLSGAGKPLSASGPVTLLGGSGQYYRLNDITGAYVQAGDVNVFTPPPPAPDPEPEPAPTPAHVVEVFIDGLSVFRKELF